MRHLPNELFAEFTYATIQKDAVWMEFEEEMEDFSLLEMMDPTFVENATLFLCGYFSELDMEMAIVANDDEHKGFFYYKPRVEGAAMQTEEFALSDRNEDFPINMLVYAATTQIMMRENEKAYRQVATELAQSKSSCAGCSGGCGSK